MKTKAVRKLLVTMTVVTTTVANAAPTAVMAEENEVSKDESAEASSKVTSDNMTVTENENEDGSTTTTYEYKEEVEAGSLAEAVEKAEQKKDEQEQIKTEIEENGGSYDYVVEIKDNSTTEDVTERYNTETEAEEVAEKVNGTVTEVEGETKEGESVSQDGFESEEAAKEWAEKKEEELVESQTGPSSEKVSTDVNISQVEGTGITVEETKDIKEQTFETEEEAKAYAETFNRPNYTITPVNGKWVYKKKEVTATDDNGEVIHFDTSEEAQKYIEDNKVEGGFLETIDIVDTDTEEVKESVVITATSYEEFVAKVNALYAEAEANENISIAESKEDVLQNYKTSINFEELSEEERTELMEQMKEDAKDQNYTYMHLDLQTAAKLNVYDDQGNATKVDCSIKDDSTLKVKVFTEINGVMTEIAMNASIEKDPQGYWEIRSTNKSLNLSKCFVLIEGTLEYSLNGETKTAPFSTTGYLNNDYNTCSQKPGQSSGKHGSSNSGGFDIVLDDFIMNSEGKVTVESSVTKVYTITVTKTITKYIVKYEVDDLTTGVYEEDYKVSGTYVEETVIPPEYMAEVTSQLTDIMYDVNYTKNNQKFVVIVDGEGSVTVVPDTPEPTPEPIPILPFTPEPTPKEEPQNPEQLQTSNNFVKPTVTAETSVKQTVDKPKTGDLSGVTVASGMAATSGIMLLLMSVFPFLRKKKR